MTLPDDTSRCLDADCDRNHNCKRYRDRAKGKHQISMVATFMREDNICDCQIVIEEESK